MRRGAARLARGALLASAVALLPRAALAFDPRPDPDRLTMRIWDTESGLPVGIVLAGLQTRDGYVWIGTEEGLVRFDGARFTVFNRKTTRELDTSYVRALYEDPRGTLWIGTFGGGLLAYARGEFTRVAGMTELGSHDVKSIAGDASGKVYVVTEDGSVARVEDGKTTRLLGVEAEAQQVAVAPDGAAWIARRTKGLARFDGATWSYLAKGDGLSSEAFRSVLVARDGVVYAGAHEGAVNRIDHGAVTILDQGDAAPSEVYAMTEDAAGEIWLATADAGLRRLHGGRFRSYGVGQGLPNEKVFTVFTDRERSVWAGTLRGLVRAKRGAFTTYDDAGSRDPGTVVWCVLEDGADGVWVGTQTRGVEWHRPSGTVRYTTKDGLDSDEVVALERAKDGVWVGTREGLDRIEGGKVTRYAAKDGLPPGSVYALTTDANGDVWVGLYGTGLARLHDGVFTSFGKGQGFPIDHVNALAFDDHGTLWVGGEEGLGSFRDGRYTAAPLPPGDIVMTLLPQAGGVTWIGLANNGLGRLENGKLATLSTREGLFGDTVFSIFEDAHHDLWMSANVGVSRIAKRDAEEVAAGRARAITSVSYGREDGMRTFECNGGSQNAATRTRDGRLWFATAEGVAVVDPEHLPRNDVAPSVVIEEVRASGQLVREGERLPAGARDVEIHYSAPSFVAPERVPFQYRLDGFDRDWVAAGSRRVAFYTNLAPGAYTFRVVAANEDGVWNEAGSRVTFVVPARLHEMTAVRVMLGGLVLAAIYGSVRLRERQLKARAAGLEARVRERTAELSQANSVLEAKDARIRDDLAKAREFQQRLLPTLPEPGAFRFAAVYEPADEVGGDIYDVSPIAGGFRVFVADTTGHGVQASLRTILLKTEYDRVKTTGSPGELLAALNTSLCAAFPSLEMRCSAVCFDVLAAEDGRSGGTLRYANAAHPALLHLAAGAIAEVYTRSPFLGMLEGMTFDERTLALAPGDRLIVFTDGLPEQECETGDAYGMARLRDAASAPPNGARESAAELASRIVLEVRAFAGGRERLDDAAVIVVDVAPEAAKTPED